MTHIIKGWGFDVGQDFARAVEDTPIEIDESAYAKPGHVVGYIAGNPKSTLGFLRHPKVRVHVQKQALSD